MNNKKLSGLFYTAVLGVAVLSLGSCSEKKFNINGTITQAKDSVLYLENMSLNGPKAVDSVKLDENGNFEFKQKAPDAPEFYRLRIANQMVNLAVDSTESITVKAAYPTMSVNYEVSGSEECAKIRDLAYMQLALQRQVTAIANSPTLGVQAVEDSVTKVLEVYKNKVKLNYIFKEPMKAYSYYALFQTIVLGNANILIFNPRSSKDDVKVFAAVATSWDTYFPKAERGLNLHNIAIEGMKNVRIAENNARQTISADKVKVAGVIDIALTDNHGRVRKLTDLKGKVVLLDFQAFAAEGSLKRIMMMREIYNKYHDRGFEIYQVSFDPEEHFWKTKTAALPWVSVWDENGTRSTVLSQYNVQTLPTFFLIDRNNTLQKRDAQIKDLDAEIQALL
ncbi:TlpA disulfide reductase family protein [Prevotella sp. oral taxon 317]|jgi:lipoprotein|uniref:TlpA disulfide reductase family protein n=1 Tax=Prevotella sp. oral taxon 317 TaxID=652721 RepID=UPI0001C3FA55|nr:TlpA disulfide reductase family protein [Prevotella sp. oral taxon 317]EFC68289.1 antioxidant, AhpC/TSA family [Prevotella sp. oral taxon 317 str. F0108]